MLKVVKTENGWVKGIPAADPRVTAFKGIPFAAPPVGELRWKGPQPAADWEGVRECYTFGPIAMQKYPGLDPDNIYTREWNVDPDLVMSEDCLQLNVWTPAKSADEKLPVMVWFYGGGLQEGHPSEMEFDGERIARRGVILVSVNYRVNIFGFFAHPEITATAEDKCYTNFGSYDQRFGVLWVKRNIAAFGGDPDNITIFGQSAGGRSTLFQLISPLNDTDHIKKAISMSSGGISMGGAYGYPTLAEAEANGVEFFKFIGVNSLAEAKEIDSFTLRDKMLEFMEEKHVRWGFNIDGVFVNDDPVRMMADNKRLPVPLICGHTTGDMGDMFGRARTKEDIRDQIVSMVGEADAKEVLDAAGYDDKDLDALKDALKINNQRFGIELLHMNGADHGLTEYFYSFGPEIPGWDNPGAFHSSDLWFIFETLAKCWRPFQAKHYDLARLMCNYWTNFAKTGDPNGNDADGTPMPVWEKFTNENPRSIMFEDTVFMQKEPERPAIQLLLSKAADKMWRK
ncbi:MAG: carboxylesterase family protein [Oscillospiraceae bacterium]|nr:carboxylesterase family protein [Oscillospiraceae bacterium]